MLGDDATIIDVMEWMINIQLGRRNLPPAQRLAVIDKFKKKIQEQAKEKMSEGGGDKKSDNYKNRVSTNGEKQKNIHTDKELAKMAGVGTGTVAYDTKEEVMRWMLDIQLGRRNLSPIQRIAVAEKYRPIYERQATINKSLNGGDKKSELVKLPTPIDKIDVRKKLASVAKKYRPIYEKQAKMNLKEGGGKERLISISLWQIYQTLYQWKIRLMYVQN